MNYSPVELDIYWDDGSYGVVVANQVKSRGGEVSMSTFPGHRFFWTIHGRRQQAGKDVVVKPGVMR